MSQQLNLSVAFIAGSLAFFSPCLFPVIPGFFSVIAGEAAEENNPLEILPSIILFVLGFTVVFSLLGLSASLIGSFLLKYRPLISRLSGIFIILLGLSIMKVINIPFLMQEKRPIAYKGSSFMLGIAFGFGWSPCLGLILVSILTMAGTSGSIIKGVSLLIFFCFGLGLPFIVFGTLFTYLSKVFNFLKKYHNQIYMVSGIILILNGLLLVSGKFFAYSVWVRSLF